MKKKPKKFPKQKQKLSGSQSKMNPEPEIIRDGYIGSGKLKNKIALITGGDSGIGRSVAVHFAREGADIAIVYHSKDKDAKTTQALIEKEARNCLLIKGNLRDKKFCKRVINQTIQYYGNINIIVNNAAEQHPVEDFKKMDLRLMEKTFQTNIFSMFYLARFAIKYLNKGDSIINTTSVTSYRGSEHLVDYSSSKGAITAFTRSLGKNLAPKGIRVNGVAPGPIWTPLIVASFKDVTDFGKDTPMGRAGQPSEVAPAYVFLASEDSSYITSQVIHPNGGEVVNA